MQVKAQLQSYENLDFSLKITAPVEDWRELLRQLEKMKGDAVYYAWPVGGIVGSVRSMLDNLDKTHADAVLKEDQFGAAVSAAGEQK
jgi:hypothetical protein